MISMGSPLAMMCAVDPLVWSVGSEYALNMNNGKAEIMKKMRFILIMWNLGLLPNHDEYTILFLKC